MRDALDAAELTAEAVAKAVDGKVLECFEAARKIERERSEQVMTVERKRLAEGERRLQEQVKSQSQELLELRQLHAEAEARAKQAEDALAKRRQQPAAVGRTAKRDFAALVGAQADCRLSQKLARNGDYEVWIKADVGDGTLVEIAQPLLVDVKRDGAALQELALTKLVRDCHARDRLIGVLVADRVEEVAEIFGTPRVRVIDGVTILLTSIEAFLNDVRLLAPYMKSLVDAQLVGDESLLAALSTGLGEVSQLVAEIEKAAEGVAGALEKQVTVLRSTLAVKLCRRVNEIVTKSQQRLADAAKADRTPDVAFAANA